MFVLMADTLEELCGKMLVIDGEKNEIQVTEGKVANIKAVGRNCLVGENMG
jgi:hypothetical protein